MSNTAYSGRRLLMTGAAGILLMVCGGFMGYTLGTQETSIGFRHEVIAEDQTSPNAFMPDMDEIFGSQSEEKQTDRQNNNQTQLFPDDNEENFESVPNQNHPDFFDSFFGQFMEEDEEDLNGDWAENFRSQDNFEQARPERPGQRNRGQDSFSGSDRSKEDTSSFATQDSDSL